MRADEMFEKIKYKEKIIHYVDKKIESITYRNEKGDTIEFNNFVEEIKINKNYLIFKELQVINAKVKELGWNVSTVDKNL